MLHRSVIWFQLLIVFFGLEIVADVVEKKWED
jgi:hypothetical protein